MQTRPIAVCFAIVIGFRVGFLPPAGGHSAAVQAADAPPAAKSPLSPDESLKAFRLAGDLKIEIVAAEPEIVSPVSIAFDEDGRLWVVEMSDYPNGPDVGEAPKSRIKLLEDRDADGRFETAHIFADKLLFATGVQPWRGGVIVTLGGEIAYFKDTDGDGKADLRETWYRGFVEQNPQLRANHPRFAIDNHVYVANGLRGGTIVADQEKWGREIPPVPINGKDFRFDPRTGECEAVSGNGQFGLTFDDFGNRFVCANRNPCRHVVLEDRYLKGNPFLAVRDVAHDVSPPAEKSRIFPVSRAWTTSNLHAGQFTAACGVLIYRGDALSTDSYYGNSFVCEPTGNLVHRDIVESDGATFKSHYAEEGVEFLASPDEWFRPVDLANGPDGALYVVDMYRAVIEHPEWVPAELKNRPDLYDGSDRGRIYRIVSKDKTIDAARRGNLQMSSLPAAELVQLIEHPNAWQRETAARLLFDRNDKSVVAALDRMTRSATNSPASRVLALHLLDDLGSVWDSRFAAIFGDRDPRVVGSAIGLSESRIRDSHGLRETLANDLPGPPCQLALSLGTLGLEGYREWREVWQKLTAIALENANDEWVRHAVLTSGGQDPRLFCRWLLSEASADQVNKGQIRILLREVAEIIGARYKGDEIVSLLGILWAMEGFNPAFDKPAVKASVLAVFNGFGRGIARRGGSFSQTFDRSTVPDEKKEIRQLLTTAFEDAATMASNTDVALDLRLEAISALQFGPFELAGPALLALAKADLLQEVRLAAIDALTTFDDPTITPALLAEFPSQTPAIRRRILQAMLRRPARIRSLLSEIEAKRFAISELDAAAVQLLTNHKDEAIRDEARRLLALAIPADRQQVLATYQSALTLEADAQRGQAIFEKNCATCHKIGDVGVNVAPDISDSRTRTPKQLLTDILNPNQAIDNNYVSYTILTKDGKAETGVVATETAASITLRQPEGKTVLILKQEIEELKSNGISFMPEGLEKNITVEQMADLILFIKNWRYLDGHVPLGKQ